MNSDNSHRCPVCARKTVQQVDYHHCPHCHAWFDDDPDEGTDYDDRHPERRLERAERQPKQQRRL